MKHKYLKDVVTLKLDQNKCTGCGMCIEVCPQEVLILENGKTSIIDRNSCIECGACAKNCLFDAFSVRTGVGCAHNIIKRALKGSGCGDKSSCRV